MNNERVHLVRTQTGEQGTFGYLILPEQWYCRTLELPWQNNQKCKSCIPTGEYSCQFIHSPHFGGVYWVQEVPSRSGILIHSGNWAGDKEAGWHTHSLGCILLGKYAGVLRGQQAVLVSRATVSEFEHNMRREPFILEITEVY